MDSGSNNQRLTARPHDASSPSDFGRRVGQSGPGFTRRRIRAAIATLITIGLGLAAKRYAGPGHVWVNNWGPASVAYECMFILLAFIAIPRREAIVPIGLAVFLATCVVEFMQLWHPPRLDALRSTFLGRSILGTTFSWWDFPAYAVGCAVGVGLLGWLSRDGLAGASANTAGNRPMPSTLGAEVGPRASRPRRIAEN